MWARIEDGYYTHPKILAVGRWGRELHLVSIVWVARHAPSTGIIPMTALRVLGDLACISRSRLKPLSQLLVEEGLWESVIDHWVLHNYAIYLPENAMTQEDRHKIKVEAGRAGGLAKARHLAEARSASFLLATKRLANA